MRGSELCAPFDRLPRCAFSRCELSGNITAIYAQIGSLVSFVLNRSQNTLTIHRLLHTNVSANRLENHIIQRKRHSPLPGKRNCQDIALSKASG